MNRAKFKIPNPGTNYKDGKLFIFEKKKVVVIKIDEHGPVAWEKRLDKPYFTNCKIPKSTGYFAIKEIINPRPEKEYIHWCVKEEINFIKAHIPMPIIEQMEKFRYSGAQWEICALAMRTSGGLDLMLSNPAIAYIVALNNIFMKKCQKPWRRARSLVFEKRTTILKKAGFPANKSAVKILSKIPAEELSTTLIFKLKTLLNSEDKEVLNLLRYLPALNLPLLRIIGDTQRRSILGFSILIGISERTVTKQIYSFIYDTIRMLDMLDIKLTSKIKTVEELRSVHNELCGLMNADEYTTDISNIQMEFPKAKKENFYAEDFTIEQILTIKELKSWGKRQENCVFSYTKIIRQGKIYIFRLTAPEEATLSIYPQGDGWRIGELLGYRNTPVSDITELYVKKWLEGDIKGNGCPLKNFPFKETEEGNLHIKPLNNYMELLRLHFSRYTEITPEDIFNEHSVFVYKMFAPEKGIVALKKINGVWETVLIEDHNGNDLKITTWQVIENWLWSKTQRGKFRQMKFDFQERGDELKAYAVHRSQLVDYLC